MKRRTIIGDLQTGHSGSDRWLCCLNFVFRALGGNIKPLRVLQDPNLNFTDIAVDPENDLIVVNDENRFTLSTYRRDLVRVSQNSA